jgi:hypothetical protein
VVTTISIIITTPECTYLMKEIIVPTNRNLYKKWKSMMINGMTANIMIVNIMTVKRITGIRRNNYDKSKKRGYYPRKKRSGV